MHVHAETHRREISRHDVYVVAAAWILNVLDHRYNNTGPHLRCMILFDESLTMTGNGLVSLLHALPWLFLLLIIVIEGPLLVLVLRIAHISGCEWSVWAGVTENILRRGSMGRR